VHGANSPFPAGRSFIKLYKSDPLFSLFQKKEIGRLILLKKLILILEPSKYSLSK